MVPLRFKVFTCNIHKGFSLGNQAYVLEPLREALRGVAPDLVLLQEVLGEHTKHRQEIPDWPEGSQFEFLAVESWSHVAYGRNAVYSHGHHGNAILSKFPIVHFENIDITQNKFESRGILHGHVPLGQSHAPLHVFCLHFNLLEGGRKLQLKTLCERIDALVPAGCPLVIGGDFNDWRGRATAVLAERLGVQEAFRTAGARHARTFPARRPVLKLDRLYFRNLKLVGAQVLEGPPWNALSDHLPLLCEFETESAPPPG